MLSYGDAKAMAKVLRKALGERGIEISHSTSLELVARQFGLADWNTLAARLTADGDGPARPVPEGWHVGGSAPERYWMGAEDVAGGRVLVIAWRGGEAATAHPEQQFGTLMQSFAAEDYRGRRLQLTAELKAEAVAGAATLWMRVDGPAGQTLAFDNLEKRTQDGVLTGTKGWTERRIVLDVAEDAASVHFGFYLRGAGTAWLRRVDLRPVSDETATTVPPRTNRRGPTNLDFQ